MVLGEVNSLGDMSVGEAWFESRALADAIELGRPFGEAMLGFV